MLTLDLDKPTLVKALEGAVTVLKRNNTKEVNPLMKDLRDKDILKLQTAIGSIAEAPAKTSTR